MNSGCTAAPAARGDRPLAHLLKVGGTDVRTISVAEIDNHELVREIRCRSDAGRFGRSARKGRRSAPALHQIVHELRGARCLLRRFALRGLAACRRPRPITTSRARRINRPSRCPPHPLRSGAECELCSGGRQQELCRRDLLHRFDEVLAAAMHGYHTSGSSCHELLDDVLGVIGGSRS